MIDIVTSTKLLDTYSFVDMDSIDLDIDLEVFYCPSFK